jgi:uroporphyrinogen decarboxylase
MYPCGGWFNNDAIEGISEVVAESDEWVIRRNGSGAQLKWWKYKSGTPEHIGFDMTSREVWERDYRPHIPRGGKLSRLEGGPWRGDRPLSGDKAALATARANHKWAFHGHVFIWETMRQSMGDLTMYQSLLLDPLWIQDFNRVYTDYFKSQFELVFQQVGIPDGVWIYEDLAYRNGLFASPDVLARLIIPYFAELVDFFHEKGLPVVLHSCGNVTEALPLIVDAGFDALQPMEIKAGCDPFAFAEEYGDDLAFIGGLDVRFLETNDRDVIEREVSHLVEGMKARGARYLFHSDHSITPLVTYDSYRYALDVYRKHMTY